MKESRLAAGCEKFAAVVFVTAQVDAHTVQRIHKQVPGAPVVPKPFYTDSLAQAVATAVSH